MRIPERIGVAYSGGGMQVFLGGLGCVRFMLDAGFPRPRRAVGTSGGAFAALVHANPEIFDAVYGMIMDDGFQADAIFRKVPWYDIELHGLQEYVFPETVAHYLGDIEPLIAEMCAPNFPTHYKTIATRLTPRPDDAPGELLFEEHFSSRRNTPQELVQGMFASAVIPVAYPMVINGEAYIDGGFSRYYPLGVACKDVELGIGYCLEMQVSSLASGPSASLAALASKVISQPAYWVPKYGARLHEHIRGLEGRIDAGERLSPIARSMLFVERQVRDSAYLLPRVGPWVERRIRTVEDRIAKGHPPSILELYMLIAEMHVHEGVGAERTRAQNRDGMVKALDELCDVLVEEADGALSRRAVEAERRRVMHKHIPFLARNSPHIDIYAKPSPGSGLGFGLRSHSTWTREAKEREIEHGYKTAKRVLTEYFS